MRVLVAYDGSSYAHHLLDDLLRAGLPSTPEILVASVAEDVSQAAATAAEATGHLARLRPDWHVRAQGLAGAPARALIELADAWHPHLLAAGSHGRNAFGRFLLGSVSHKLVTEARCSVRIARATARPMSDPPVIVVGADRSDGSDAAVHSLAGRCWPAGTQVAVVAAIDLSPDRFEDCDFHENPAMHVAEWEARRKARAELAAGGAAKKLCGAGLIAYPVVVPGSPKRLLIHVAERIGAECIFLGASGEGKSEELGGAATTVALRASCSVEVVRAG